MPVTAEISVGETGFRQRQGYIKILNDGINTTTKDKPVTAKRAGRNLSAREQDDVQGCDD